MRASVVVPARDAATSLPALLDALAAQTAPREDFEVIVVNDASSDATAQVARAADGVRVVDTPAHVGIAAARNLGVGAAGGEVVAFVDADCVPLPSWVELGLSALDGADIVAGRIDVVFARPSAVALVDLVQYFDQERYVAEGFAATGNLWVRRDVFDRAGLFDETLERDEDREFVQRAVAAGGTLRYASDVVVSHPARSAAEQVRRCFRIGRERGMAGLRARARSGAYVSQDRMRERLAAAGYPPTATRRLAIALAKNICIRLPMAAGALWQGFRGARRANRGAAGSAASSADAEAPPPTRRAAP